VHPQRLSKCGFVVQQTREPSPEADEEQIKKGKKEADTHYKHNITDLIFEHFLFFNLSQEVLELFFGLISKKMRV